MAEQYAPGTWIMENSENFDEYMKAVGVGFAKRVIGNAAKPKQEISVDNGNWKIVTSTTVTSVVLEFELNKEFDETTADGRKVKSTCTVDGNKLITEQKGELDSTIIRDFTPDSFVMTLTAKGVTCTRNYKKQQ
ncbi:fatty acid binding protein [Elysia marginata]|uniref:Fatty acid binding protein n=1 Tax=Elysia marginata TaxID=1093978 RepID=A0AAV4HIW5_9GAST|nr:fatty acid binding protein [Elysia marginata]